MVGNFLLTLLTNSSFITWAPISEDHHERIPSAKKKLSVSWITRWLISCTQHRKAVKCLRLWTAWETIHRWIMNERWTKGNHRQVRKQSNTQIVNSGYLDVPVTLRGCVFPPPHFVEILSALNIQLTQYSFEHYNHWLGSVLYYRQSLDELTFDRMQKHV